MLKGLIIISIHNIFTELKKHEIVYLFLIITIIYLANYRLIGSGDTVPASLLPFSILENHNLYLDQYHSYFTDNAMGWTYIWFISNSSNHSLSAYPIVTPVLITPLYILPYLGMKLFSIPVDLYNPYFQIISLLMEKLCATIITALSAVILYLSLKELTNKKIALISVLIYAFATNSWTISSQALWQQGMVELLLSLMIYAIILNEKNANKKYTILAGILSGLFVFNRPSDSLLLLPILFYFIFINRKYILFYAGAFILSSLPFAIYNIYYFNNLTGGYSSLISEFNIDGVLNGFAALLISPSRGIIVYTPIILMALFGFINIYKIENKNIRKCLYVSGIAIILQVLLYSAFRTWWAGWSYGPRFLTGMLPLLVIFVALSLPTDLSIDKSDIKKIAYISLFTILLTFSIFTQIVGAFFYPNGNWDGIPQSIDNAPYRAWNITDTQISRTFLSGPIVLDHPLASFRDISNNSLYLYSSLHKFPGHF